MIRDGIRGKLRGNQENCEGKGEKEKTETREEKPSIKDRKDEQNGKNGEMKEGNNYRRHKIKGEFEENNENCMGKEEGK